MTKIKTPLPKGDKECIECKSQYGCEVHHVYGAANKNFSNEYGCTEWLCYEHHRGNSGVHGGNRELDLKLKRKHQERLELEMNREKFIKLIGRNYL